MKKMLCMLLAALMLLATTAALAEGETSLSLRVSGVQIENLEDGTARVHLLLRKRGSGCYRLQDVMIELYDEQGSVVPVAQKEHVVFPLQDVPTGEHYIPITMLCTLEGDAEPVDMEVLSVVGSESRDAGTELLDWNLPFLAVWKDDEMKVTAWMPLAEGTEPEDYFAMLLALDSEGYYLGNVELPAGAGRAVDKADILAEIERVTSYASDWLDENGFTFQHERYVFFEDIPMTHLQATPASFYADCYRALGTFSGNAVSFVLDRIDMREDGSFVIHGCMRNETAGRWQILWIDGVMLYDEEGTGVECTDFTYDMPFTVMESGELLPYVIEGRVEAGFKAETFQLSYGAGTAVAPDHHAVKGGTLNPTSGDRMTLEPTLPAIEGVDPADCFLCVMFMDLTNDVYYGAEWTYVNEAWLQDGEIRFPTMECPEGAGAGTAMVTTWYVAE